MDEILHNQEQTADLFRMMGQLWAIGRVVAIDPKLHRAKVKLPDQDDKITDWLLIPVQGTKDHPAYSLPAKGDQVACLFNPINPSDGLIIGAVYSAKNKPPTTDKNKHYREFKDGTRIEYDTKHHKLSVNLGEDASIDLGGHGPAAARLGDEVTCPCGKGTITSGSEKVRIA